MPTMHVVVYTFGYSSVMKFRFNSKNDISLFNKSQEVTEEGEVRF